MIEAWLLLFTSPVHKTLIITLFCYNTWFYEPKSQCYNLI